MEHPVYRLSGGCLGGEAGFAVESLRRLIVKSCSRVQEAVYAFWRFGV